MENVKPRTVGLLSCTRRKKAHMCEAGELYSESDNFRWYHDYARRNYDLYFIISARHGLVTADQILNPYDRNLADFTDEEKRAWARFIAANLRLEGVSTEDQIMLHADPLYTEYIRTILRASGYHITCYALEDRPADLS
jgi:hypothetical protein